MTDPILSVRASGFFGRGYVLPTRPNPDDLDSKGKPKPTKVPGITTVTGALDKPGVVQWAVDLTAAYAVANAQDLLARDEDWGFRKLRFYHSRKPDYDNPETNVNNFHVGVLDDLANQGTVIHAAIEAYIKDDYFGAPDWTRPEQEEAFGLFVEWAAENVLEWIASESTVIHPESGYAGTGDIWVRLKDSPEDVWYIDVKSSRNIHDTHVMQGAAIKNAPLQMVEAEGGVPYKGREWVEVPAVTVTRVGVLQVRQVSVDEYGNNIPAFVKLHEIPEVELEPAYEQFLGALQVRKAQAKLRDVRKVAEKIKKEEDVEYF